MVYWLYYGGIDQKKTALSRYVIVIITSICRIHKLYICLYTVIVSCTIHCVYVYLYYKLFVYHELYCILHTYTLYYVIYYTLTQYLYTYTHTLYLYYTHILYPGKTHTNQVQLIFEVLGYSDVRDLGFTVSNEAASFLNKRCRSLGQGKIGYSVCMCMYVYIFVYTIT